MDGVTFVELPSDSLVHHADTDRISATIDQVIDSTVRPQIVLNFAHVQNVSSVFLGRIMVFQRKVKAKGGRLALTNVSVDLKEMLTVTRIINCVSIIEPGRRLSQPTVAWVVTLAVACTSAAMGLYLGVCLVTDGTPSRGLHWRDLLAEVAIGYFIATIPLAAAGYVGRRPFVHMVHIVQWVVAGVICLLSVVVFVIYTRCG